jgi:glutamate racemase
MTSTTNPRYRVLVFDSGLGGLSIVKELTQARLSLDVYYLADTALFPYGEKSDATLIGRVPNIIEHAIDACGANLVIIACNTASTLALEEVRLRVKVPVIGVVPAIKPASGLTKTGVIGLLATPNTVIRPYTDKLIADFAPGKKVIREGAFGLAGAVETLLSGGDLDLSVLRAAMDGMFKQESGDQIDVVVLACTHYPHVQSQLSIYAPGAVQWVDSGAAIAKRVATVLRLDMQATPDLRPELCIAYTTGGNDKATTWGVVNWGFNATAVLA